MSQRRLMLGAIIMAGVTLRVVGLDRWPGINGDEAWYGVNAQLLLEGQRPFFTTGIGNPQASRLDRDRPDRGLTGGRRRFAIWLGSERDAVLHAGRGGVRLC